MGKQDEMGVRTFFHLYIPNPKSGANIKKTNASSAVCAMMEQTQPSKPDPQVAVSSTAGAVVSFVVEDIPSSKTRSPQKIGKTREIEHAVSEALKALTM